MADVNLHHVLKAGDDEKSLDPDLAEGTGG